MNLGAQMAKIRVDYRKGSIFNTGRLKIKILKSEAQGQIFMNLHPQMADISMDNQMANFNTGPYGKR